MGRKTKGRKIYKTKEKNYYGKTPLGKAFSVALSVLLIGGLGFIGYNIVDEELCRLALCLARLFVDHLGNRINNVAGQVIGDGLQNVEIILISIGASCIYENPLSALSSW